LQLAEDILLLEGKREILKIKDEVGMKSADVQFSSRIAK
jgi:hypothetical protein